MQFQLILHMWAAWKWLRVCKDYTRRESEIIEASAQRQRESMSKALRYMLQRGLSRGWVAWQSRWAEATRKRESMRRGLGHQRWRALSQRRWHGQREGVAAHGARGSATRSGAPWRS